MKKSFIYLVLLLGSVVFVYPFIWMLSASLSPESAISNLVLFPTSPSLNNYSQVLDKIPAARSLLNSLFVSLVITMGVIIRSEEHTSELQSLRHLVCRLLLE